MRENDENDRTSRSRTTLPDASADWRTEYAVQEVDADLRADGGTVTLPTPGDRVRDREHDDELVVVEVREDTRADDYRVDALENTTVADVNTDYDPSAPVVEAIYRDELTATLDGWRTVEDLRDAVSFGAVNSYSFPADRVSTVGEGR